MTFDSRVILYDSASITALNTISCSAIKNAQFSHFIGSRYLLIASKQVLLLWDLILQSSRSREFPVASSADRPFAASWTYRSAESIESIVPHPTIDSFAIFYATSSENTSTTLQVFGVSSAKPQLTQSIPLRLRTSVWLGPSDGSRTFSLVALTDGARVVVVGNGPNVDQPRPAAMSLGFTNQKVSLFQDIFGSPLDVPGQSVPPALNTEQAQAKSKDDVFPSPAYLTPSLSSLCTPIFKNFLSSRVGDTGAVNEQASESDEEMEDDAGVISSTKPASLQLSTPTDQLVQFFKLHSIGESLSPRRSSRVLIYLTGSKASLQATVNGVKLPNGSAFSTPVSQKGSRTHKKSLV